MEVNNVLNFSTAKTEVMFGSSRIEQYVVQMFLTEAFMLSLFFWMKPVSLSCYVKVACLDVTSGGLAVSSDTDGHLLLWTTDNGEVRVCFFILMAYTLCIKKNSKNCFCHNFVKCLPTLIIFFPKMVKMIELCKVHLFFTLLNLYQCTTV